MVKKIKKDVLIAMQLIAKQFNESEVYSGKEIKQKIDEIYPDIVEFNKKTEKVSKPYKKQ